MKRRTFIRQTAAVATGIAASLIQPQSISANPASRIVDTHTHFFDPSRKEGVPWPSKGSFLDRTVLPPDWLKVASPQGVKETVVVEASSWLEDNAWILDLAAKETSIVGFVGHLLPHDVDFPKHLKRFGANPIFRGIRVNHDDFLNHLDNNAFRAGIKLMADMGLELDLNGPRTMHLPAAKLAGDVPDLRIVIDHVGSAGDAAHLPPDWLEGMKSLGKQNNIYCKVSALQEQTDESEQHFGHAPKDSNYYAPLLDHCWQCFGEDRLIYGSNWPVSEKGGGYADQFKIVSDYFTAKSAEACEKYFWKNAAKAYRFVERNSK